MPHMPWTMAATCPKQGSHVTLARPCALRSAPAFALRGVSVPNELLLVGCQCHGTSRCSKWKPNDSRRHIESHNTSWTSSVNSTLAETPFRTGCYGSVSKTGQNHAKKTVSLSLFVRSCSPPEVHAAMVWFVVCVSAWTIARTQDTESSSTISVRHVSP